MKTTITVEEETRKRLNKLKYALGSPTLDDTINRSLDILEKMSEERNGN